MERASKVRQQTGITIEGMAVARELRAAVEATGRGEVVRGRLSVRVWRRKTGGVLIEAALSTPAYCGLYWRSTRRLSGRTWTWTRLERAVARCTWEARQELHLVARRERLYEAFGPEPAADLVARVEVEAERTGRTTVYADMTHADLDGWFAWLEPATTA